MKKIHQLVMDYTHWQDGKRRTERKSFASLENAVKDASEWAEGIGYKGKYEVHHIEIVNKETGEVEWSTEFAVK